MIYLDLDDTLNDYTNHFLFLAGGKPGPNLPYGIYDLNKWLQAYGVKKSKYEVAEELGQTFWASLPKSRYFYVLESLVRREDAAILTAGNWADDIKQWKADWVRRNIPGFRGRLIFEEDKVKYARPGDVLIDDNPKHVSAWRQAGGIGILTPAEHNEHYKVEYKVELLRTMLDAAGLAY